MTSRFALLETSLLAAFAGLALATPAQADFFESCPAATTQVYAFTCADTSNTENGAQLIISNGQLIAGKTGSNSFETTNLGAISPGQAIRGNAFGIDQGSTGLSASTSEKAQPPGTGTMKASAQTSDTVNGIWSVIPFANANPHDSSIKFQGNTVIPNLHAIATGSIDQPTSSSIGGQSVQANATASFSDVVSISNAELAAAGPAVSGGVIRVQLAYSIHGTANFSFESDGSAGEALGNFTLSAVPVGGGTGDTSSASFDLSSFSHDDDLLNETFIVDFFLNPGNPELISATLNVSGIATDSGSGPLADFNSDLSDTAQFLGAKFFADEAETIPLPTLELNSEFGFNYAPVTIAGDVGGVPEPAAWTALLTGIFGIGTVLRKRWRVSAILL